MRVLVACEFSGTVRDAFTRAGHDAISVDLEDAETSGQHFRGDILAFLEIGASFDLMIAHPPCTYLSNSGVRWLHEKPGRWGQMKEGAEFFSWLLALDIPRVAVENPVIHGYAKQIIGRGQDQTVQPWQFGHGEVKRTCFWLKNLPKLVPTDIVDGREARVHKATPSADRWKERSRFFPGIAKAMADQWGGLEDTHEN